jgi:hypothetical protein
MKNTFSIVIILFFVLAFAFPALPEMYQWKDKDGNVFFSDTPPADEKAKNIIVRDDVGSALEKRKWAYLETEDHINYYYDSSSIKSGLSKSLKTVWIKEAYPEMDDHSEIYVEINCEEGKYKFLAKLVYDVNHRKIGQDTMANHFYPDDGVIQEGTYMDALSGKVCVKSAK